MKSAKYVLSLLLIISIFIWGGVVSAEENHLKTITLEEAIILGLSKDAQLQQCRMKVELAKINLLNAEVNLKATVTPLQFAEIQQAYDNAVYEFNLQLAKTALNIEKLYYGVLKATDTLTLRTNATIRVQQQRDIARMRHGAGQITDLQLRYSEQNLLASEITGKAAENNLKLAWMLFEQATGIKADSGILIETVLFSEEPVDLQKALEQGLMKRFEITTAKQAVEKAKKDVELADNEYTPKVELQKALIALEQAELNLDQVINKISYEIWQSVFKLEEAVYKYNLAQDQLDLAYMGLSLAELNYNNGLNTLLDVMNAQSQLAEAEVNAVAAAYDYNACLAEYLNAIGLGFERWPEIGNLIKGD
jgi:outer membrane protein